MKKNIYLIGGGGHCVSVIDVIEATEQFEIKGIFDQQEKVGSKVLDYPVIGTDKDLSKYNHADNTFLITIGQIKSSEVREKIFNEGERLGLQWATVVSPFAYISKRATIDYGTVVMHGVLVNAGVQIGRNCILNTKSLIEHESRVEDHCHIATSAVVNGQVVVGAGSFVGSGSVIRQNIHLPHKSFVQAGAFLNRAGDIIK